MNPYAESCAFVADDPKHVFIDLYPLKKIAVEFAHRGDLITPPWREEVFPESDEKIIEFFGVVNSINFCFTDFLTNNKFDVEYPEGSGKIWRGAFAMTAAMRRALDDGINILDPRILYQLTSNDVKHIFRHVSTPIPMLKERFINLQNVGKVLSYWCGSFTRIFREADYKLFSNGDGIVEKLAVFFESYRDVSRYRGRFIEFYKRAQLFPLVYHGRALSSNGALQPIRDPENFGPIADYEVPKVLRALGILIYEQQLAEMVDRVVVLPKNSNKEIEIRAQTVNAMAKLLEAINKIRVSNGLNLITMVELDYAIWSAGRTPEYKKIRHHYTYTTAY
jgi:hypothetical protein